MRKKDQPFNILSLDGGGVRGIFAGQILNLMHDKLGIDPYSEFNLFVGTSTGSIVAASLATHQNLSELVEDYESFAPSIFKKRLSIYGMLRSRYNLNGLESFIQKRFDQITLGQITVPLIINATNISTGNVHVLKSSYQNDVRGGDYYRDGNVPLYKAVLASCAGPTFFDPVQINDDLLCDGGLWANNPSLVGYVEALRNFKETAQNIRILSIGTGSYTPFYLPACKWGLMNGWKRDKIVDLAMICQTQHTQNCLDLIIPNNILRIDPKIDNWKLDDCKHLQILKSLAEKELTHRGEHIKKFLHQP